MVDWQPAAKLETLRTRARMLQSTRAFFSTRDVLEVDTPVLSAAAATDVHLESFATVYRGPDAPKGRVLYLHTSPEFAMKRLLASDSGAIYQLCKTFRQGETGTQHNPEFTMLEWYRPHYDATALMDEVEEYIATVLGEHITLAPTERLTYAEAFKRFARVDDVHAADTARLRTCARERGISDVPGLGEERDAWLDLLMSHVVQPQLGQHGPSLVYDYPATQAALARVRKGPLDVAERFELFINGMELANGFHELTDITEQRRRFASDRARRQQRRLRDVPQDEHLLAALESGLPPCAGVALGFDRLVMLATGARRIGEVMAFPLERA
ncbi:MAG: EF-P lysine aminoacylase GenX [Gammaproteobacteria bacterium]|nr:EF-P lysine aminoacylase GenX [Gammaproteobacteria bacterium]